MKVGSGNKIPSVHVYCHQQVDFSSICDILFGIEEEGVPYHTDKRESSSALDLACFASEESQLGVGIGIGKEGDVILHYLKLNRDQPLFKSKISDHKATLRALGANGARLVKGLPFKDLDKESEEQIPVKDISHNNFSNEEIELIKNKVIEVLNALNLNKK